MIVITAHAYTLLRSSHKEVTRNVARPLSYSWLNLVRRRSNWSIMTWRLLVPTVSVILSLARKKIHISPTKLLRRPGAGLWLPTAWLPGRSIPASSSAAPRPGPWVRSRLSTQKGRPTAVSCALRERMSTSSRCPPSSYLLPGTLLYGGVSLHESGFTAVRKESYRWAPCKSEEGIQLLFCLKVSIACRRHRILPYVAYLDCWLCGLCDWYVLLWGEKVVKIFLFAETSMDPEQRRPWAIFSMFF